MLLYGDLFLYAIRHHAKYDILGSTHFGYTCGHLYNWIPLASLIRVALVTYSGLRYVKVIELSTSIFIRIEMGSY